MAVSGESAVAGEGTVECAEGSRKEHGSIELKGICSTKVQAIPVIIAPGIPQSGQSGQQAEYSHRSEKRIDLLYHSFFLCPILVTGSRITYQITRRELYPSLP